MPTINFGIMVYFIRFWIVLWIAVLLSCNSQKKIISGTQQIIEYVLCGNVTQDNATLSIKANTGGKCTVKLIESQTGKTVKTKVLTVPDIPDFTVKEKFTGLKPNTKYTYQIFPEGNSSMLGGNFTTFSNKPFSYTFAFGSCMETGSNSDIFLKIKEENHLFFLQGGDLHYENIDSNCTSRFNEAYKRTFTSPHQSALYRSLPFVYMWDDHDFGPNNADATNPCRKESVAAYHTHIPHYPFAFSDKEGPISQSFSAGRVMFILTDIRSQKVRPVYNECERLQSGTNFGSEAHLTWFLESMLKAKNDGKIVAWVSSYSWVNAPGGPNYKCKESDNWGGYPEERQRIANFIKKHQIPVFILSGDAHMVAMDDGSNSDYAENGGASVKVFHAAALAKNGSYKGGPYSHGYSKEPGQYGVVEVLDEGKDSICFKWYGKNKSGQKVINTEGKEISLEFCMDVYPLK